MKKQEGRMCNKKNNWRKIGSHAMPGNWKQPLPCQDWGSACPTTVGKPPGKSDSLEEGLSPPPEVWSLGSGNSSGPSH